MKHQSFFVKIANELVIEKLPSDLPKVFAALDGAVDFLGGFNECISNNLDIPICPDVDITVFKQLVNIVLALKTILKSEDLSQAKDEKVRPCLRARTP